MKIKIKAILFVGACSLVIGAWGAPLLAQSQAANEIAAPSSESVNASFLNDASIADAEEQACKACNFNAQCPKGHCSNGCCVRDD